MEDIDYLNKRYRFLIKSPLGWRIDDSGSRGVAAIFFGPKEDRFTVNISITVQSVHGMGLEEYISVSKRQYHLYFSDYNLIFGRYREIDGIKAYESLQTYTHGVHKLKNKQVYIFKDRKVYVVTFTALQKNFERYEPFFEGSVKTLEIIKAIDILA